MKGKFLLFSSQLDLAHMYWERLLVPTDVAVDATAGNGKDTLKLARLLYEGQVIAMDVQKEAIVKTRLFLEENLSEEALSRVHLFEQSHATFPSRLKANSVKLIVYNLGYLPGHDKSFTTSLSSTLESVTNALPLIINGGALSITCYPGHAEGGREETALLEMGSGLNPQIWSVCHHKFLNRAQAPSLILIQKHI